MKLRLGSAIRSAVAIAALTASGMACARVPSGLDLQFLDAATRGDASRAAALAAQGANANATDDAGQTALCLAVEQRNVELARVALNAGAQPDRVCRNGFPPVALAALHGDAAMVQRLLRHRVRLDVRSAVGNTPLHYAVVLGRADVVDLLLAAKPDVEIRNAEGRTALALAAEAGRPGIVRALLRAGADYRTVDGQGWPPLFIALLAERFAAAEVLLANGASAADACYPRSRICPAMRTLIETRPSADAGQHRANQAVRGPDASPRRDRSPSSGPPVAPGDSDAHRHLPEAGIPRA